MNYSTDAELARLRRERDRLFAVMDTASDQARAASSEAAALLERMLMANHPGERAKLRAALDAKLDDSHQLHLAWRDAYRAWDAAAASASDKFEALMGVRS